MDSRGRHPLLLRSDERVNQARADDGVHLGLFARVPAIGTTLRTALLNSALREMRASFAAWEAWPAMTLALDCWSEFVTAGAVVSWHALQQCSADTTFCSQRAAALDGFVSGGATNEGRVTAIELVNHANTW
jgi:hypothetical protein